MSFFFKHLLPKTSMTHPSKDLLARDYQQYPFPSTLLPDNVIEDFKARN